MALEDIDSFKSQSVQSPAASVSERVAEVGDRAKKDSESESVGEELREKEIAKEEEKTELNKLKASFSEYMRELASSSTTVEGDIAGKTDGVAGLYKFIENLNKTLDYVDPKKLAELGSFKTSNKTSEGKIDKSETGIYGNCEECGKALEKPSSDGFCSKACAMKHFASNVSGTIADLKETKENFVTKINAVTSAVDTFTNSIGEVVSEISSLPGRALDPRWEIYFKVRLNTIQIYLKKCINDLLIQKNMWVLHQVEKGKSMLHGKIGAALEPLEKIQKVVEAAKKLVDQMNSLYDKAYKMVVNSLAPFKLDPESMNFNMTVRSNTYYPGKFAVKLKNNNTNDSICDVVNTDAISSLVENAFPHINENEYVMEPEAFNVRKVTSEYNRKAILKMTQALSLLLKLGSEPLPEYKDLKITNVWWLVFLLTSFEPQGQRHYALPFAP